LSPDLGDDDIRHLGALCHLAPYRRDAAPCYHYCSDLSAVLCGCSCLQTWATTTFDTSMWPRAIVTVATCLLYCAVVVVSRPGRRRHSSSRSTMSSRAVRHQTRHGCSVTRPPRRRRFVARSSIVLYNSRAVKRTFLRFRF